MPSFDDATIEEWRASRILTRFSEERWVGVPKVALLRFVEHVTDKDIAEEEARLCRAGEQVLVSRKALRALRMHRQRMLAFAERVP